MLLLEKVLSCLKTARKKKPQRAREVHIITERGAFSAARKTTAPQTQENHRGQERMKERVAETIGSIWQRPQRKRLERRGCEKTISGRFVFPADNGASVLKNILGCPLKCGGYHNSQFSASHLPQAAPIHSLNFSLLSISVISSHLTSCLSLCCRTSDLGTFRLVTHACVKLLGKKKLNKKNLTERN